MRIGYARVSTREQSLDVQMRELKRAGCTRIFAEKASGRVRARPELDRLLDQLRKGDVVVVTRLDRIARSTRHLLDIAEAIGEVGAGFKSLAQGWADTTSAHGRYLLTIFAGVAEFERELIAERTKAGREAARERGVRFGRKPKLGKGRTEFARRQLEQGVSAREVAEAMGVSRATIYRALQRSEAAEKRQPRKS